MIDGATIEIKLISLSPPSIDGRKCRPTRDSQCCLYCAESLVCELLECVACFHSGRAYESLCPMSTSFFKGLHWLLASLALFVFLQLAGDSRDLEDMVGKGSTSRAVSKERQTKRPSLSLSLSAFVCAPVVCLCGCTYTCKV